MIAVQELEKPVGPAALLTPRDVHVRFDERVAGAVPRSDPFGGSKTRSIVNGIRTDELGTCKSHIPQVGGHCRLALLSSKQKQFPAKRSGDLASKSGKHLAEVGSVGSALTADRSPSRVRTGPISDSEAAARRQRVLQVASELFLQQGYSGTSIDEIARRSRVGKATIYAECGSKQDMFREFYTSSLTPFRGNLRQAIELGGSLDQVVRQVVRDVLRTNEDRYAVGLLRLAIAESERFPEIAVFALENGAQAMRPFALFLRDQVGHDNMSDKEAARYTLHLFNMALGGSAVLLTDADSFYGDKEGWIESVSRIFLEGIQRIALPDACG